MNEVKQSSAVGAVASKIVSRSRFKTPLSHWAMHWRDATFLNSDFARAAIGWLVRNALAKSVDLPAGCSLARAQTWRSCLGEHLTAQQSRWEYLIAAAPESLRSVSSWLRVANGVPDPKAVRLHPNAADSVLTAVVLGRDKRGPSVYARRHFKLTEFEAVHAYLAFTEELRGNGFGVAYFDNALPLYRDLGVRRIYLTAGLSVGGAIWGKFGFKPSDSIQWTKVKRTVRQNLRKLPDEARAVYQKTYQRKLDEVVETILRQDDPTALWLLQDMDPMKALRGLAGMDHGLSGALLRYCRWKGILDLEDPSAYNRLREYLDSKRA